MKYIYDLEEYNEAFSFSKVKDYLSTIKDKMKINISLGDITNFYKNHKGSMDTIWDKIITKFPDTLGSKKGIKLTMSDNVDDVTKGTIILGIILTNNIKKRQYKNGETEEEILNDFREFLKNKNEK